MYNLNELDLFRQRVLRVGDVWRIETYNKDTAAVVDTFDIAGADSTNPTTLLAEVGKRRLVELAVYGAGGPASLQALVSGAGKTVVAAQLSSFSAALAATIAGTADTKIAFLGDSVTLGNFGGGSGYVGSRPFSRANKFAAYLQSVGIPALTSNYFADSSAVANLPLCDTRITLGTNWGSNTLPTLGGTALVHATAGSYTSVDFSPTETVDTVDVYYITNAGYGSADIYIDGVKNGATMVGAGALAIVKATRTMAPGQHKISVQKSADGNFFVLGVDAYNSTSHAVRCWNMAAGGLKAGDFALNSNVWDAAKMLQTYAPDLTFISLGINDWIGGTVAATYQTNISTIIDAARASGDVIIEVPVPSSTGTTSQANQEAITFALRQTAANKGCPIADLNAAFRNYTAAAGKGYFAPLNDLIHPGPTGYALASQVLAKALFR